MNNTFLFYFISISILISCNNSTGNVNADTAIDTILVKGVEINDDKIQIVMEIEPEVVPYKRDSNEFENKLDEEEKKVVMDVFDPDFINGKWEAEDQNEISFNTWFDSQDGMLIGQYCAMNIDASRIDCGTQDEVESCYLKSGPVKGKKTLELEVVSCYALKKGKATLTPQGDGNIIWRLVEEPGQFGVDHFAPKEALLRKISFDPYD